jgi:hypothetical protein
VFCYEGEEKGSSVQRDPPASATKCGQRRGGGARKRTCEQRGAAYGEVGEDDPGKPGPHVIVTANGWNQVEMCRQVRFPPGRARVQIAGPRGECSDGPKSGPRPIQV